MVEDLADWGTSNEEGRRLYALAVTKKNVTSNAARIACLWSVAAAGKKQKGNECKKMRRGRVVRDSDLRLE